MLGMIRVMMNIAALMLGALGVGWAMAWLIEGGLSLNETGFLIAAGLLGLTGMLLTIVDLARADP